MAGWGHITEITYLQQRLLVWPELAFQSVIPGGRVKPLCLDVHVVKFFQAAAV
jgi:hypothetical protein